MEALTLTVPQSVASYTINSIMFEWNSSQITVVVNDGFGKTLQFVYAGLTARNLMISLNKANLTTTSLQKRVLQQLVTDGYLPAGSVTGTPD